MDATADLDWLGDEIAELSAHLDAATARLLDLIREFDVRGGRNANRSSRTGRTFPRKRPGGWRATPAGW
jgi:hypothetical protein